MQLPKAISNHRLPAMLVVTFCAALISVPCHALRSGIFEFEVINGDEARITGYNYELPPELIDKNLEIPAVLNYNGTDYRVVEIGDGALSSIDLTYVSIPEGVTTIGDWAFGWNKLTDVVLPQSLTGIYSQTFVGNDLKSINLPPHAGLIDNTNGGAGLFNGAGGDDGKIENIIIEESSEPLNDYLGVSCGNLTLRRPWTDSINKNEGGVTDVLTLEGNNIVFDVDFFINFTVMPRVINIRGGSIELTGSIIDDAYKMRYNKRHEILQAASLIQEINIECANFKCGRRAFSNLSGITEFKPSVSGQLDLGSGSFHNCEALSSVDMNSVSGLSMAMLQNCRNLGSFSVPGDCAYINSTAFLGCDNLRKVVLSPGDAPLVVGTGTFDKMPLTELTLGRNVMSGDIPFYGLKSLEKLTLAENITELPDYAFAGCDGLREIYCESATPPAIHPHTFDGVSRTECKVFVRTNEQGYAQADGWDEFFASVETVPVEETVTNVYSRDGNLCITGAVNATVAIYSTQGAELMPRQAVAGEVSVALPSGTYIIVIGNRATKYNHTNR